MKYIQPQVKTCKIDSELILVGSVTGDNGLGYGGVDEGGTQVPDANDLNIWSDDDNEWPKKRNDLFED